MNVLIAKVMEGLAKNQFGPTDMLNKEQIDNCTNSLAIKHSRNIRGMTSAILERIFISHVE